MNDKIFASSAYDTKGLLTIDGKSFTNKLKRRGPNAKPCGTLLLAIVQLDDLPFNATCFQQDSHITNYRDHGKYHKLVT